MNIQAAQQVLDVILQQITGRSVSMPLEEFVSKYAFDIRLPSETTDVMTGQPTWAGSLTPQRFASLRSTQARAAQDDWVMPKQQLSSIQDVLNAWSQVNITATERFIESDNIGESDTIYSSQNVFRSLDVHLSKNIIYCDSVLNSEFVAASTRSNSLAYCARIIDSKECSTSFEVNWSGKVANSMFIQNCYDMYECMFCSHMASKRYCIANMQFEEAEYMRIKAMIIDWLLQ